MLVYAKTPRGILHIYHYKIYGAYWAYPPVDIPFQVYLTNRDALQDATYREGVLSSMFGKPFPEVAFTYGLLRHLPERTINTIGPLMVDAFNQDWSFKKKIDQIKIALQNVSPTS